MALPESTTRILFTEDGKPIEDLPVRFGEQAVRTDSYGQVELSLSEGHQMVDVHRNGEWTPQLIEASHESSLIIVDLNKRENETEREEEKSKAKVSFLDIGKLNLGDRYIYEEVIGRGGMSVVLKARDRLLNRDVAIKLLSQELQEQAEAQNVFLTEARNLARLSHPNLVAVHDICKVEDQVFMVIEFIEGESLGHLIDAVHGFNETVALQTIIQLSRVVGYLHAHGIIHRDLKPTNAMIRSDGTLKLIDFGLARHFDDLHARGTRVRGTPAYMSPEQIRGDKLTPACDVYQLGVCLFEVVTGELPFSKGDISYAHRHEAPPRANELNSELSEALTELIDQCLDKDPARRPPDGQALLKRLQAIYQAQDATGSNILEQLRQNMDDPSTPPPAERVGYSDSEVELMEGAGKHLRTSDFAAEQISKILSDPDMQSRIVINTGPRWLPIVGGVVAGMVIGGGIWFAARQTQNSIETSPSPAIRANAPAEGEVIGKGGGDKSQQPVGAGAVRVQRPPPVEREPVPTQQPVVAMDTVPSTTATETEEKPTDSERLPTENVHEAPDAPLADSTASEAAETVASDSAPTNELADTSSDSPTEVAGPNDAAKAPAKNSRAEEPPNTKEEEAPNEMMARNTTTEATSKESVLSEPAEPKEHTTSDEHTEPVPSEETDEAADTDDEEDDSPGGFLH